MTNRPIQKQAIVDLRTFVTILRFQSWRDICSTWLAYVYIVEAGGSLKTAGHSFPPLECQAFTARQLAQDTDCVLSCLSGGRRGWQAQSYRLWISNGARRSATSCLSDISHQRLCLDCYAN